MSRVSSKLRLAVPLALFLSATALSTMFPSMSAFAKEEKLAFWQETGSYTKSDGSTVHIYRNMDDPKQIMVDKYNADGELIHSTIWRQTGGGNPSPDDPSSKGTGIEPPNVASMIAKGLISYEIRVNPENTPLSKWIDRQGDGFVPHWNNDEDKGPGKAPNVNTGGRLENPQNLTPKQIAEIAKRVNFAAKSLATIGGSMGDGIEGLAGEDKPTPNKNNGSSGRKNGTGHGSGDGYNVKYNPGGEASTLGPRPDLVNPAPKNKTGTSKLFAPGLLDGHTGFAGSGPAATGTLSRAATPGAALR